jgi:hypothetical protein
MMAVKAHRLCLGAELDLLSYRDDLGWSPLKSVKY